MNRLITSLALAISCISGAQNYTPIPIDCDQSTELELQDDQQLSCFLEISDTSLLHSEFVQYSAGQGLNVLPATDLTIENGGAANLQIRPPELSVAWFDPIATPLSAPVYEKVEVGVDFPSEVDDGLDAFLQDPSDPSAINPFNPEEIDVYAIIIGPNGEDSEVRRINLFYYDEFERNHSYTDSIASRVPSTHPSDHYGTWNWIPINTDYRFRMRYAPLSQGTYSVSIQAQVGQEIYKAGTFEIEATAPIDERGFVRRSNQVKYLEFANGELYFPIGHQVGAHDKGLDWKVWWERDPNYDENCLCEDLDGNDTCDTHLRCVECVPRDLQPFSCFEMGDGTYAQALYMKGLDDLEELKNSGANTGRVVLMPWSYDVEYDDLNDYSKRMHCAWEFDRFIDKASEIDIHLIVNLQAQYPFQYAPFTHHVHHDWATNFAWDTSATAVHINQGFCYQEEMPELTEPLDFFKSQEALEIYKRKIRYYIARYGYSKQISLFEIMAEVQHTVERLSSLGSLHPDGVKSTIALHHSNIDGAGDAMQVWHENISQYIKEGLGHQQHLLGVHYLNGGPTDWDTEDCGADNCDSTDDSYGIPWVDIMGESRYTSTFLDPFDGDLKQISSQVEQHQKPFYFSEYGVIDTYGGCSRPVSAVRDILLTGFGGSFGLGMNWDSWTYQDHSYWSLYEGVQSFFSDLPLNTGQWVPISSNFSETVFGESGTNDNLPPKSVVGLADVEALDDGKWRVVGAIANNSYNNFTMVDQSCACANPDNEIFQDSLVTPQWYDDSWDPEVESPVSLEWGGLYDGIPTSLDQNDPYLIELPNLQFEVNTVEYSLRFFNPFTSEYYGTEPLQFEVFGFGHVPLPHPYLNVFNSHVVFFELWPTSEYSGVRSADDLIDEHQGLLSYEADNDLVEPIHLSTQGVVSLAPNPTHGWSNLEWQMSNEVSVQVFDSVGRLVEGFANLPSSGQRQLRYPPGIYVVKLVCENRLYDKVMVVQ